MMEENPEYFFGDVDDFFAPDTIRARVMHRRYETWGLSGLRLGRISQVGEKSACTSREVSRGGGGEVGEEEADDDIARGEFTWPFLFHVKEHGKKSRKQA